MIRSVDRVPEELWMEVHNIVQEAVTKTIPKKKKCKKAKWLSLEGLQITKKREAKGKGEKERYTCMQVNKQQLEPGMEQWTGSKQRKKSIKAVFIVTLLT